VKPAARLVKALKPNRSAPTDMHRRAAQFAAQESQRLRLSRKGEGSNFMWRRYAFAFVLGFVGCGQGASDGSSTRSLGNPGGHQFSLAEEPAGAIDVVEMRETVKDGAPVVVVGSVGGGINPWIKGRAAFVLVDACASMKCDGSCCEEGCNCEASELTDSIVVVKFVDQHGKVIETDARELLGLRRLDTVVVQGRAKRDLAGNIAMVADGLYIRR